MEASNKSEKKEMAKSISDVFNMLYNTGDQSEAFTLEIDRQIRPTVVAVAKDKSLTNREKVGKEVFTAMLQTLVDALDKLLPDKPKKFHDVYFTYSSGTWQRTGAFHIKAHLTTDDFLSLLKKLYEKDECPKDQKKKYVHKESEDKLKAILEKRFKGDHHGGKLREHAGIDLKERTEVHSSENFCVTFTKDLDYPLLALHHTSQGAVIQIHDSDDQPEYSLAKGLSVLEAFVTTEFIDTKKSVDLDDESNGYAIGMVLAPVSSTPESKYGVYAAAIVYEPSYATYVKKGEKEVIASWRTEDADRSQRSDDFLVLSLASSLATSPIVSYWTYIQQKKEEWQKQQKSSGHRSKLSRPGFTSQKGKK